MSMEYYQGGSLEYHYSVVLCSTTVEYHRKYHGSIALYGATTQYHIQYVLKYHHSIALLQCPHGVPHGVPLWNITVV